MIIQDAFVGFIAVLCGLTCWFVAIRNEDWGFRFWMGRMVDSRWGRARARQFYGIIGLGLIVLGSAISMGWRWPVFGESQEQPEVRGLAPIRVESLL